MWSANRHPPPDANSAAVVALRWMMAGLVVTVFVCEVAAQAPPPQTSGPQGSLAAVRSQAGAAMAAADGAESRTNPSLPVLARASAGLPAMPLARVADQPALSRNLSNLRAGIVAAGDLPNPANGRGALKSAPGTAMLPLSLIVRHRVPVEQTMAVDASGAGRPVVDPALVYHPDKVGLEWKPARSTIGLDHGALGLSLDSGYKLSIKSRRGGPMVYVRGKF
jgi:hypothetical protein